MRRLVAFGVVFAVFAFGPALAQTDRTGVVEGIVRDDGGRPVEGAVVQIAREDGSYPNTAVTASDGAFRLGFLPPGAYRAIVQATGFREAAFTEVRVRVGASVALDVRLEPLGEFRESVTVVATAPAIDLETTEYSTSFTAEDTERLPFSRDANALLEFVPGGSREQLWGGSTDQSNSYQLDGVNVNDPGFGGSFLLPNVDWIEEFQVKGLGAGAEYGNFQGGLVNIVTKSGSNTFEGAVRTNYENADWNSSNVNTFEAGQELDRRFELNANVSGPIVKDKLYYFVSAARVDEDTRVVDVLASSTSDVGFLSEQENRVEEKLYGKLTWQVTPRDIVNVVLGIDDVTVDNNNLNSIDEPSTATDLDSPATFWNVGWQRVFSPKSFFEIKFSGYASDESSNPLRGTDTQSVQWLFGGDRKVFRNAKYDRARDRDTNTIALGWDYYLSTGSVKHHLKIGADYNEASWLERRTRTGQLTWRPVYDPDIDPALADCGVVTCFDPGDPSTWVDAGSPEFVSSDWGAGIRLDAEMTNAAAWIQDYIDLTPDVTLSAGLRFGRWTGDLTPGFGGGSRFEALSADGFDPRIGVTWDVTGEQKWVAKAHWGRYHQNLFALFFDRAEGGNVFEDESYFDWDGDPADIVLDRTYTDAERDALFVDAGSDATGQENGPVEDYEQPYVDQWVAGVERAFNERWKGGLTYVHRDFKNIVGLIDRNLDRNYLRYENVTVTDFDAGTTLTLPEVFINVDDVYYVADAYGIAAPGLTLQESLDVPIYDPDFVLTNLDGAERSFDQVQVTVARQGSRLSLDGSLVWTDFSGNFFNVQGYANADGTGAGPYVDPNGQINFEGNLSDYAEWTAKLTLTARLPWDLRLGAFLQYDTGFFYTPTFEIRSTFDQEWVAENGEVFDPDHFYFVRRQEVLAERRGSREYDSFVTLDLHLDRPFRVSDDVALSIGVDVFNVTDADAVTSVTTLVNDPAVPFGDVRRRQNPRTFRMSAALTW